MRLPCTVPGILILHLAVSFGVFSQSVDARSSVEVPYPAAEYSLWNESVSSIRDLSILMQDGVGPPLVPIEDQSYSLRGSSVYSVLGIESQATIQQWLPDTLSSLRAATSDESQRQLIDGLYAEHVANNSADAYTHYLAAAESNLAPGQILTGRALLSGYGVSRDVTQAKRWFSRASQSPYASWRSPAYIGLAMISMLEQDHDSPTPSQEGTYLKAAATLDSNYIPDLVNYLIDDGGLHSTDETVIYWVNRAAIAGNISALRHLYYYGDPESSRHAIANLAAIDHPRSYVAIGDIYRENGTVDAAYDAFVRGSRFDPYALAQAGILSLQYPEIQSEYTQEEVFDQLRFAADRGEASAAFELATWAPTEGERVARLLQTDATDVDGEFTADVRNLVAQLCGGREGVCPGLPVWYITNREYADQARGTFGTVRLKEGLNIGTTRTSIITNSKRRSWKSSVTWNTIDRAAKGLCPSAICQGRKVAFDDPRITPWEGGLREFLAQLKRSADAVVVGRAVVYIHGYNTPFDAALRQLARIIVHGPVRAMPILLSWASAESALLARNDQVGIGLAYSEDRRRVLESCSALRGALVEVVRAFGSENVSILAHSMGTRVIREMVFGCGKDGDEIGDISVKGLAFAAADIGQARFGNDYRRIRDIAEHLTLYVADNDGALLGAMKANMDPPVGLGGLHRFVADDAVTVDVSSEDVGEGGGLLNHAYVFDVRAVRRDVAMVLSGFVDTGPPRCLIPLERGGYELCP